MSRIATSILAALGILLTTSAAPQGIPQSAGTVSAGNQYLASRLTAGMTLANYLQSLRAEFAQLDADGDGVITPADVALHDAVTAAAMRAVDAQQIMSADLDGDGVVTEDEVRRLLRYRQRMQAAADARSSLGALPQNRNGLSEEERFEQEVRNHMAADTGKKGRITWEDAIAFIKTRSSYVQNVSSNFAGQRARLILKLVSDGADSISLAEVLVKGEAFFHAVDTDGNGTISLDELQTSQRAANEQSAQLAREQARRQAEEARVRKEAEAQAACGLPKASDGAKVILLGTYGPESLSDTTIGSQDEAVTAGGIVIEPGDEPLYLVVASFEPTIWRVSGAVDRVERLVLSATAGKSSLVGATGIAADRISFPPHNCIEGFWEDPSTKSAQAAANVRRDVGKQPAIFAKYSVAEFVVPSGQLHSARSKDGPTLVIEKGAGSLVVQGNSNVIVRTGPVDLADELSRFYPGGVQVIDPAAVVASQPAQKYQVLPQQAGLIQLVQSGALKRDRSGEFLIQEKIRFPAGMYGAHAVKFLLLRGVPRPDGDPGHSTVISEETGRPIEFK